MSAWPPIPLADWRDTCTTIHLWSQIVGKIRLALAPPLNHWWHVTFYVTSRGLTTSPMPHGERALQLDFDFIDHCLDLTTSDGGRRQVPLVPMTVADFYDAVMQALAELEAPVSIWPLPVEIPDPVTPFPDDRHHASYDGAAVNRFWRVLVRTDRLFDTFNGEFLGKASPSHFFWGGFDLAATRFSGRPAPPHPGGFPNIADWVVREAYSHEVASAGFWPGSGPVNDAAFYAYAYPEPKGYAETTVEPAEAYYHPELREFVLPYEAVRQASDPDRALLAFLRSTYAAAADRGGWNRTALER